MYTMPQCSARSSPIQLWSQVICKSSMSFQIGSSRIFRLSTDLWADDSFTSEQQGRIVLILDANVPLVNYKGCAIKAYTVLELNTTGPLFLSVMLSC